MWCLDELSPDIAISDISMPGVGGLDIGADVVKRLKRRDTLDCTWLRLTSLACTWRHLLALGYTGKRAYNAVISVV
jgi:CheY-like chemotaxis protein